jgi:hypothetical protein
LALQVALQHSPELRHGSPFERHTPTCAQRRSVPEPGSMSAQAFEQHDDDVPAALQLSPATLHELP